MTMDFILMTVEQRIEKHICTKFLSLYTIKRKKYVTCMKMGQHNGQLTKRTNSLS